MSPPACLDVALLVRHSFCGGGAKSGGITHIPSRNKIKCVQHFATQIITVFLRPRRHITKNYDKPDLIGYKQKVNVKNKQLQKTEAFKEKVLVRSKPRTPGSRIGKHFGDSRLVSRDPAGIVVFSASELAVIAKIHSKIGYIVNKSEAEIFQNSPHSGYKQIHYFYLYHFGVSWRN